MELILDMNYVSIVTSTMCININIPDFDSIYIVVMIMIILIVTRTWFECTLHEMILVRSNYVNEARMELS